MKTCLLINRNITNMKVPRIENNNKVTVTDGRTCYEYITRLSINCPHCPIK